MSVRDPLIPTLHETTNIQHVDSPKAKLIDVPAEVAPEVIIKDTLDAPPPTDDVSSDSIESEHGNIPTISLEDTTTSLINGNKEMASGELIGDTTINERNAQEESSAGVIDKDADDGSTTHPASDISPLFANTGVDHDKTESNDTTVEVENSNAAESITDESATDVEITHEPQTTIVDGADRATVPAEDTEQKLESEVADIRHEIEELASEPIISLDESIPVNSGQAVLADTCREVPPAAEIPAVDLLVGIDEATVDVNVIDTVSTLKTDSVPMVPASSKEPVIENTADVPSVGYQEPDQMTEAVMTPAEELDNQAQEIVVLEQIDDMEELVAVSIEPDVLKDEPQVHVQELEEQSLAELEVKQLLSDTPDGSQVTEDQVADVVQTSTSEVAPGDPESFPQGTTDNPVDDSEDSSFKPSTDSLTEETPNDILVVDDKLDANVAVPVEIATSATAELDAATVTDDGPVLEEPPAELVVESPPAAEQSPDAVHEPADVEIDAFVAEEVIKSEDVPLGELVGAKHVEASPDYDEPASMEQFALNEPERGEISSQNIPATEQEIDILTSDASSETSVGIAIVVETEEPNFLTEEVSAPVPEIEVSLESEPKPTTVDTQVEEEVGFAVEPHQEPVLDIIGTPIAPVDDVEESPAEPGATVPEQAEEDSATTVEGTLLSLANSEEVESSVGQVHQPLVGNEIINTATTEITELDNFDEVSVKQAEGLALQTVAATPADLATDTVDQANEPFFVEPEESNGKLEVGETLPETMSVRLLEATQDERERPISPWSPSYDVNTQGGAPCINQEVEELEQLPVAISADIVDTRVVKDSEDTASEHRDICQSDVDMEQGAQDLTEVSIGSNIDMSRVEIVVEGQQDVYESSSLAGISSSDQVEPDSLHSLLVENENVAEERPKSPWTPSYSVTTLPGSSPRVQLDDELEEVEHSLPIETMEQEEPVPADLSAAANEAILAQASDVTPAADDQQSSLDQVESDNLSRDEIGYPPVVVESPGKPEPELAPNNIDSFAVETEVIAEEKLPPTWSPSYSVTTLQGSSPKLEPEEVPPVSIQESAQEQTNVITALLTSSGLQPSDEELAVIESLSDAKDVEMIHIQDEPSSQPIVAESIVAQSSELNHVLGEVRSGSDQAESDSLLAEIEDIEEEKPKSPWTPSYSVTTLPGSSPRVQLDRELEEAETSHPVPEPVEEQEAVLSDLPAEEVVFAQPSEKKLAVDSRQPSPDTVESDHLSKDEISCEPAVVEPHEVPAIEEHTLELVGNEIDSLAIETQVGIAEERPGSTWSPSYSVTTLQRSSSKPELEEVFQESGREQTSVPIALPASSEPPSLSEEPAVIEPLPEVKDVETIDILEDKASPQPLVFESSVAYSSEPNQLLSQSDADTEQSVQGAQDLVKAALESDIDTSRVEIIVEGQQDVCESDPPADISSSDQAKSDSLLAENEDVAEERPKSPWTPSYSVTRLPGSSPHVQPDQELEEVDHSIPTEITEQKETVLVDLPATTEEVVFAQPSNGSPAVDDQQSSLDKVETGQLLKDEIVYQPVVVESLELSTLEPELELVLNNTDAPATEVAAEEGLASTWSPSYSVTTLQGLSPKSGLKEVLLVSLRESEPERTDGLDPLPTTSVSKSLDEEPADIDSPPDFKEADKTNILENLASLQPIVVESLATQSPQPEIQTDAVGSDAKSLDISVDDQHEARPKSPWTPSYSVTSLHGSSPRVKFELENPTNIEGIEQLPSPISVSVVDDLAIESANVQPSTITEDSVAQDEAGPADEDILGLPQPESGEPEDSLGAESEELVLSEVEGSEVHALPHANLEILDDIPERPWTPSYSSYTQGPGVTNEAEDDKDSINSEPIEPQDDISIEIKEVSDATQEFPRLEDSLDTLPGKPSLSNLQPVDPSASLTSGRSRYESTTSSRLFPGGWFSSPKSPSDEGRASLDEAVGEFVPNKAVVVPKEPTVEETSEEHKVEEKKSRWCTIM